MRGTVEEVHATLAARAQVRGEMVLLFSLGLETATPQAQTIQQAVQTVMQSDGLSEMDALKRVARERGIGKSEAYRELQREQSKRRP